MMDIKASDGPRRNVLVLQGGGALGSYQAGAYEGLHGGGHEIDWVAGVSIGAINAALIAGNAPEDRPARLREFWEAVTAPSAAWPDLPFAPWQALERNAAAASAIIFGQPGFFKPRGWNPWSSPHEVLSYYSTGELKSTLERLIDFDRINHPGSMRLSVGAVEVRTGNLVYFDNRRDKLRAEHVMASGALPPGLATVEIDGRSFWDGGLVSNTPLDYVMEREPRERMLIFQIDLFPARGKLPENLDEVAEREKDIRYSSRTRSSTTKAADRQALRSRISDFLARLPDELSDDPVAAHLRDIACPKAVDIVHLIYRPPVPQGSAKDFEFSRGTMRRRWKQGAEDTRATIAGAPWQAAPGQFEAVRVFDVLATARR